MGRSVRFDALEYLTQYRAGREAGRQVFPAIHYDLFQLIVEEAVGRRALDLCCSTGLLAQRLAEQAHMYAVGVDADRRALDRARQYGVTVPLREIAIEPGTFDDLVELVLNHRIGVLVARRCMPELFGHDMDAGREFVRAMHRAGISEVFLQGRVETKGAVNRLRSIEHEVALWIDDGHYRIAQLRGQCAYLGALGDSRRRVT